MKALGGYAAGLATGYLVLQARFTLAARLKDLLQILVCLVCDICRKSKGTARTRESDRERERETERERHWNTHGISRKCSVMQEAFQKLLSLSLQCNSHPATMVRRYVGKGQEALWVCVSLAGQISAGALSLLFLTRPLSCNPNGCSGTFQRATWRQTLPGQSWSTVLKARWTVLEFAGLSGPSVPGEGVEGSHAPNKGARTPKLHGSNRRNP